MVGNSANAGKQDLLLFSPCFSTVLKAKKHNSTNIEFVISYDFTLLTLSQTTNFGLFQTERVRR